MERKTPPSFIRIPRKAKKQSPREGPPKEPELEEPPAIPEASRLRAREEAHTRIVIPREERGAAREGSALNIELREVRYGTTTHGPYLRVVPKKRRFTRLAPGYLEATELGSQPTDRMGRMMAGLRRIFIGSPLATSQAIHERLSKVKALSILGSDPLSSSAYATEEALIILALAGSAALVHALPIAGVLAALYVLVTLSYRQTQKAYPGGGGAYIVAHENLGKWPGLTAAAALIVDYVLLVSVSVAAGVAAITSAAPELHEFRVPLGALIVGLFTLGNLRGIRESGTLFAAPTYFFIVAMSTVIMAGLIKVALGDAPGSFLESAPPREEIAATQGVTLWLILRAFSSGGAALTGVEAMSNAVPNFKPPESRNAQTTLTVMAGIAIFLFVGVTFLSSRYGLVPREDETLVSMLGKEVLGSNFLYYAYQAATALILFMAANTSFNAFPLLSAILARDRFMPRQFSFRGDRLAYSNGIVVLAALALLLLVVFAGEVTRLIPLYATGVFISFTLSQSGMVRRWWRLREPGWRISLAVNGVGALATGVVSIIIAATKFTHGAWISILLMITLMVLFNLIFRHYNKVESETAPEKGAPVSVTPPRLPAGKPISHVIVPVNSIDRVSIATARYACQICDRVTAVHIAANPEEAVIFRDNWSQVVPEVPLLIIESPYRAFIAPMLAYLESLENTEPGELKLLLTPTLTPRHWWERPLHSQTTRGLKPLVRRLPNMAVAEYSYKLGSEDGR